MSQAANVKTAAIAERTEQTLNAQPTPEHIRQWAYEIYVSRNGAPGDEVQDWPQAERELGPKQL
jgi:hypothetical protein